MLIQAMLAFLTQRILQLIPTLFFVSIIIFGLQQLLPGDPALIMAGEERDPEVLAQIRAQYRLDEPLPVQYFYWVEHVLRGDLGKSILSKLPVSQLIMQRAPATLELALAGEILTILIGIPLGLAIHGACYWLNKRDPYFFDALGRHIRQKPYLDA